MISPILFKSFNYAFAENVNTQTAHLPTQPSLVNINIDFEQGLFKLDGDWKYMMACNKHAEESWFCCHSRRVAVNASLYPGYAIDLADEANDGMVFAIDGVLADNNETNACSGLLVLDKAAEQDASATAWKISLYLYDEGHENCEIAFRLPVYDNNTASQLN